MTLSKSNNSILNSSQGADNQHMTITINEQRHKVEVGVNLQQIIVRFSLPEIGCVFAINNYVIPRSEWASTDLSEGDSLSLFQAIAGG
ncbi:sulfur carrier protein ThiS [Vibrio sp. ES.051]|uniref:sulfur carrier protein ThiS n=1 Tax=Vibrio sp. ES.051 TaxID=1761909 RepID=UPI000BF29B86|nr:sulfur carrier protein ThiS [Vibrio sp. ES.051]PFG58719.1 sulfur carrier protein ThiS [Vibrio sp. ES.051]